MLEMKRVDKENPPKNISFNSPTHPHKSSMVVISHSSDSVCTHIYVQPFIHI